MWAKSFKVTLIRIEKECEMKVKSPTSAIFDLSILKAYHTARLYEGYTSDSESEPDMVLSEHICKVEHKPIWIGIKSRVA